MGINALEVSENMKNTYINYINVGGLTKNEASEELKKIYKIDNLELKYENNKFEISPSDIELSYDIDSTIESAYNTNRNASFIENIKKTISSFMGEKNTFKLDVNYNKEKLNYCKQ